VIKACQELAVFLLSPVQEPPPFFSGKAKALMCLKCTDCNYLEFRNQERNIDSYNSPQIFHQNIWWLQSKTDELINYLEIYNINPHVLCFSEHHMEEQDLLHLILPGYILGSGVCCQNIRRMVCILVHKTCISAKSILHITVQKRIWKSVPMK